MPVVCADIVFIQKKNQSPKKKKKKKEKWIIKLQLRTLEKKGMLP